MEPLSKEEIKKAFSRRHANGAAIARCALTVPPLCQPNGTGAAHAVPRTAGGRTPWASASPPTPSPSPAPAASKPAKTVAGPSVDGKSSATEICAPL